MVVTLCAQHCEIDDLCNMVRAFADARLFPTFFAHIPGLLAARPQFRGCALEVLDSSLSANQAMDMCLGPHCQCVGREEAHRRRWGQAPGVGGKADNDESWTQEKTAGGREEVTRQGGMEDRKRGVRGG